MTAKLRASKTNTVRELASKQLKIIFRNPQNKEFWKIEEIQFAPLIISGSNFKKERRRRRKIRVQHPEIKQSVEKKGRGGVKRNAAVQTSFCEAIRA